MRLAVATPLLAVMLVACGSDPAASREAASASDSALSRDIALATSSDVRAGVLGDTALTVPAVEPGAGTTTVTTPAPTPSAPPARAPRARATPTPVPPSAPAAPSAPVTPPPAAPSAPATVAPTPADSAPADAASGAAPARSGRALGSGTALVATTTSRICSRTNRVGDKLVATLQEPVTASDGSTIPAGVPVVFEVAATTPAGDITLRARAISIAGTSVPIDGSASAEGASETQRVASGDDKGKVVRGAIIGAIAGRILGGSTRGAVIGAAGGAAVGTAQAMKGGGSEKCLAPGATVRTVLASAAPLP
ncbi:MAG: hypothetical protein MUE41_00165 [Gemmatimonadaceae bacterium]|jgi:hypothetical protein|nr:hypothetical protein [Gemmatimonadaceae bacterium]